MADRDRADRPGRLRRLLGRGWAKQAPVKTQSRTDTPRSDRQLLAGRIPVAGVAWAPGCGISRVEGQVDDEGRADARLADRLADDTWRQWVFDWNATPGRHDLRVRATDGTGRVQDARRRSPLPDGATGHHSVTVEIT